MVDGAHLPQHCGHILVRDSAGAASRAGYEFFPRQRAPNGVGSSLSSQNVGAGGVTFTLPASSSVKTATLRSNR